MLERFKKANQTYFNFCILYYFRFLIENISAGWNIIHGGSIENVLIATLRTWVWRLTHVYRRNPRSMQIVKDIEKKNQNVLPIHESFDWSENTDANSVDFFIAKSSRNWHMDWKVLQSPASYITCYSHTALPVFLRKQIPMWRGSSLTLLKPHGTTLL